MIFISWFRTTNCLSLTLNLDNDKFKCSMHCDGIGNKIWYLILFAIKYRSVLTFFKLFRSLIALALAVLRSTSTYLYNYCFADIYVTWDGSGWLFPLDHAMMPCNAMIIVNSSTITTSIIIDILYFYRDIIIVDVVKINRQPVLQLGVNNSDEELREDGIYVLCDVAHNPSSISK